jgi:hypothetical protein
MNNKKEILDAQRKGEEANYTQRVKTIQVSLILHRIMILCNFKIKFK